ncbi:helix-turn-helix transcriptional regulator [Lonepinella koalarum]|uniref:helix-turn-helix domain-containing protein n=1 Tax=Lonepinella koalarum TaxID=53417 RepID=UPI0011E40E28|nr:helix-turn-helix domain-containing protein [Lonepinella koalarum]TYG34705.1 helix-turn-helix transcriptional regulator [Lonepinella koalarum]
MEDLNSQLELQINALKALQQKLLADEQAQRQQRISGKIERISEFGKLLNNKRKQLNIDLQTLSLQTDVSVTTLKRLFQDPSQIRFSTVLLVAQTLGVSLCVL